MKVVKLEDCINEIKSLDNNGFVTRSVNHICEDMRKEVKEFDAIPIPKNATNGDILRVMFNAEILFVSKQFNVITVRYDNQSKTYDLDWWNAPYKGEKNE